MLFVLSPSSRSLTLPLPPPLLLSPLSFASIFPTSSSWSVTGLMVRPPQEGSPSYPTYEKERTATLASLRSRARKLTAGLSKLEGVTVQPSTGAMYAFPRLTLPSAFLAEATKAGLMPDMLYCMRLCEATGIVVVPGSGFGQVRGKRGREGGRAGGGRKR